MIAESSPSGLSREEAITLRRLARLAELLDARWGIPGTRLRIGLDGVIGLVPGVGDLLGAGLAAYPLIEAWRLGAPPPLLARMVANVVIDAGIGSVPLVGDLFDIAFKVNRRNVELLRRHVEQTASARAGAGGARRS